MRPIRSSVTPSHADYALLHEIEIEILRRSGDQRGLDAAFPSLVRSAVDFVLDSVITARTLLCELDSVEKTFVGLKLEHLVRDMLDVPKGLRDLRIGQYDVDIKNTIGRNWMIPDETYRDHGIVLLMAVDSESHRCWLGLMVARAEYLTVGTNRDKKRCISASGFSNIHWLVRDCPFRQSYFLGLDMNEFRELRKAKISGSERAAKFCRKNLWRILHRRVFEALLFDQLDPMKRLRRNGGAPDLLSREGIAILIGTRVQDKKAAKELGLDDLRSDYIVSVAARNEKERSKMIELKIIPQ